MADLHVTEENVCCIAPATPRGQGALLEPSTFDLMQKRDVMPYLQRVAFYPGSNNIDGPSSSSISSAKVQGLKRALSLVLVDFYPFAGRLVISQGSPFIHCNDAGVEFCEASVDAPLHRINHSQPCAAFFREFIKRGSYETASMEDDVPLLSIQVTKFNCGGVCIAWSFDHILGDGNSIWHFISSWAEVCKGQQISHPPFHSRDFEKSHGQLRSLNTELSTIASPFLYRFNDMSLGVIARSFKFDAKKIENLKLVASTRQFSESKFSSFEVLSAHIWKAITRARDIPDKTRKIGYCIACNIRSKLNPPLPITFCGNAILMAIAETTVQEIECQDIAFAANLVHEAIQRFSIEDILSSIRSYKVNSTNNLGLGIDEGIHVWHGGSLRFPLYDVDFGWGKAVSVKNVRCLWDGFCYFDPSPPCDGDDSRPCAEITVCLKPHNMEKFAQYIFE
eukprot:c23548_g2_i1 orf=101-1450(+)